MHKYVIVEFKNICQIPLNTEWYHCTFCKKQNKIADMIYIIPNEEDTEVPVWGDSIELCNESCMNIWLLERINEN